MREWIEVQCVKGPRKGQRFQAQRAYIGWSVQMPDGTLELWDWSLATTLKALNYRGIIDFMGAT